VDFLNLIPEYFISDLFVRFIYIFSYGHWLLWTSVVPLLNFKKMRRECISDGNLAESFVFKVAIQKFKDQDI